MKDNDQKLLWEAYLKEESGAQPLRLYTPSQSVPHLVHQNFMHYQQTGELRKYAPPEHFDPESENPFLEIIHVEVNDLLDSPPLLHKDDPTVPPAGRQVSVIQFYRPFEEMNPTSNIIFVVLGKESFPETDSKFILDISPAQLIDEWRENIMTLNTRYFQDWISDHEGETYDHGTEEWTKEPWAHQPRHGGDINR